MADQKETIRRWSVRTPGKKVYSECFPEYILGEKQIRALQESLLQIFLEIRQLCEENGIRYMMAGGSLLGTIRHQGFIPWDDDMDIMMTRAEYDKFRKAFESAKAEGRLKEYILAEPLKAEEYYFKIPKVYKTDTEYISLNYMGNPRYNMVAVDIFLIEYMPVSRLKRRLNAALFDFAFYASAFCLDYIYPSPVILEKCREEAGLKRYYDFRRRMGALFQRFFGIRFYLKVCQRLSYGPKESSLMGIPCGISYAREIFDRSLFSETDTGTFCGYEVSIPRRYEEYLTNLYGDFWQLPPEDKREIHTAVSLRV